MLKILQKLWKKIFNKECENLVYYLCNNEALPNPMSEEEESECLQKMANGDTQAKNKLIEHNLRLVVYIAKKFENTNTDLEDLISVGSIGLIKAINTFNSHKNIKLATYSSRCIENEILMYLRKISKQKNELSLDKTLSLDNEGNELVLSDIIGVDADEAYHSIESEFENQMVYQVLDSLDEKEQNIVKMRFGLMGQEEKTQKEVAEILNISQSYISRIEKKILHKMKKYINQIN